MSRLYSRFGLWPLALALIVAATAAAFVPTDPERIERWYSTGLYPPIQRVLTSLTNAIPFSLLDVLLIVSAVGLLTVMVRAGRAAFRQRRVTPVARALVRALSVAALGYLLFLSLWGLNYRRLPMTQRLVMDAQTARTDRVLRLGLEAVAELNRLYGEAHRTGWPARSWEDAALVDASAAVQRELTSAAPAVPGRMKASLLGAYFRWTGVDGMVNPFGLDVIANPDLLPFERPFVAAHEWAHLAGFAEESEASFVGFLTCVRSSPPNQYSGWLFLYWQIAGETDAPSRTRMWNEMQPGPRADVEAVIARLRRGQLPRLRAASWLVYDQYLKANRVESGVRSYGEVVNLLVRARFDEGWIPVRSADSRQ